MGAHLGRRYITERDTEPDPLRPPTFDPQLGFPDRKERGEDEESLGARGEGGKVRGRAVVMIATQQQMNDAMLPLQQRDYCAHYLIKLMKCKRDNWPNFLACKHERHDWDYCEHQE
nr:PREDICTED: NADH dehydrogenase [ubiquinone] 1 beta subcomplex subunit 7 isoform X1 [Latimeria chalumnae]|eukprot:XP_014354524.1 PREDICTED: NADH dehydrogenase [ubiquinone] 1 beta subcomplex subunit 7 isoform X1 [Latimeria chalumnae]